MDEICTVVPVDKIDETLNVFNSFHDRVRWVFLDILLIREESSKWYRKPTSCDRFLDYNSAHHHTQILGTAYGFDGCDF